MLNNNKQLGKWFVFRIIFDLNNIKNTFRDLNLFEDLIQIASKYNLISKSIIINNKQLNIIDKANLCKYIKYSILTFNIFYIIKYNILFNYIYDYNLSEKIFSLLA